MTAGRSDWLADPFGRFEKRYWNGQSWTSAVMDGDQVKSDPEFEEPPMGLRSASEVAAGLNEQPLATGLAHAGAHGTFTSLDPAAVCRELPPRLSANGVGIVNVSVDRIQGVMPTGAGLGGGELILALILLFVCLIPGIVYLVWAMSRKRGVPFTLTLVPQGSGTVVVPQPLQISNGPVGLALLSLPR
jgi:hypothetical protein